MITRWLKPGLGIKRWILLIAVSALAFGLGITKTLVSLLDIRFGTVLVRSIPTILGAFGLVAGIGGLIYSITSNTYHSPESLFKTLQRQNQLQKGPNLVAFGGGTGLSILLSGLKSLTANITAVVAVTDDGGSSGRLRRDFDLPAPGDLRNCLVALAPEEERLSEVVSYRFTNGDALKGHSLGNLLLTALTELTGGFPEAIRECSEVLNIQGRVLPSMLGSPQLRATMPDGSVVSGERTISNGSSPPAELEVQPESVDPNPEAVGAVMDAEMIIVGPGSLFTSILSNFLEPELCKAVVETNATKVYISNLMTQAGETDGFTVSDHLDLFHSIPPEPINFDYALVNTRQVPQSILQEYEEEGARQVILDYDRLKDFNSEIVTGDFLKLENPLRHDVAAVKSTLKKILASKGRPL